MKPRLSAVVARLTAANVLGAASGFITGPLLARGLGASGRGDLAAILVPLTLAPPALGLGIPAFAYRELPRGRPLAEVIGSLGLPLVVVGAITAACAVPIADALAGGRETVHLFLVIGLALTPIALIISLIQSSLAALERWRRVMVATVIPFSVALASIVALYATGHLTVATAAAGTFAGAMLAIVPGLVLVRQAGRPVIRLPLARAAVSFGLKSWFGGLAMIANVRLDQLLMITLVAPRELGLYAVATTLATASNLATGALSPPLMTRIAAGDTYLLPKALRTTLASTIALNALLALATPVLLPTLFGSEFRGAIGTAMVLLAANISFSGARVLSSALQAHGAPIIPSIGEVIALVITVPGLIVLLPALGGLGASLVSLSAFSASFVFQLIMAKRRINASFRHYLLPSRADFTWAGDLLKQAVRPA